MMKGGLMPKQREDGLTADQLSGFAVRARGLGRVGAAAEAVEKRKEKKPRPKRMS